MTSNIETLLAGEKALDNAPKAELADGRFCIPQHYLSYQHTLQSVEQLLLDIDFDPRYPIFVSQNDSDKSFDKNSNKKSGIYIQVGIVGTDNYKSSNTEVSQDKIVYGRKWRIEPQLPTSEIIQTVFLALKKAREHEVRELFRLESLNKTTTPFNNHHDLPLLTNSRDRLQPTKATDPLPDPILFKGQIEHALGRIDYGGMQFELMTFMARPTGEFLVDLKVVTHNNHALRELSNIQFISFFINKLDVNYFLHQLMQQLIQLSDRYVDEAFTYRGFNRFSWDNNIEAIAQLSSEVRQLHKSEDAKSFTQHWQLNNYETDRSRIPVVSAGPLWCKLQKQLESFLPVESTLPIQGASL
jgi:hypothetical protein